MLFFIFYTHPNKNLATELFNFLFLATEGTENTEIKKLEFPRLCECLEAAVIGFFRIGREAAAGQLFGRQVILQTRTADALIFAARIRTGANTQILTFSAFHKIHLSYTLFCHYGRLRAKTCE
jgi:hypothetical protein